MKEYRANLDGRGKTFSIVISRFNETISQKLLEGCLKGLTEKNVDEDKVSVYWVPGAFEIPTAANKIAKEKKQDTIICLGCVIRGETPHFDYICQTLSSGIACVSRDYGLPVIFGVLCVNTPLQANERAGADSKNNKGYDAALAAIEMANFFNKLAF